MDCDALPMEPFNFSVDGSINVFGRATVERNFQIRSGNRIASHHIWKTIKLFWMWNFFFAERNTLSFVYLQVGFLKKCLRNFSSVKSIKRPRVSRTAITCHDRCWSKHFSLARGRIYIYIYFCCFIWVENGTVTSFRAEMPSISDPC